MVDPVPLAVDPEAPADHTDFLPFFTQVKVTLVTFRVSPAGEHAAPGVGLFAAVAEVVKTPSSTAAAIAVIDSRFMDTKSRHAGVSC